LISSVAQLGGQPITITFQDTDPAITIDVGKLTHQAEFFNPLKELVKVVLDAVGGAADAASSLEAAITGCKLDDWVTEAKSAGLLEGAKAALRITQNLAKLKKQLPKVKFLFEFVKKVAASMKGLMDAYNSFSATGPEVAKFMKEKEFNMKKIFWAITPADKRAANEAELTKLRHIRLIQELTLEEAQKKGGC